MSYHLGLEGLGDGRFERGSGGGSAGFGRGRGTFGTLNLGPQRLL